ncbi:MAG: aspartate carbamoyltransferase [Clostridiales bacterium]|jgi:aspartate carbamoyltransferase catalytic subunit|nr:aspartate carbamoyltransferase [Clostridiales bacterium]
MRHILDPLDLSVAETDEIIALGESVMSDGGKYSRALSGKILATLFYEPSTRTRLSFESAMLSMGGGVIGFSSEESSSVVKGENIADTIRTVSHYADICAIRHPKEGSALVAAQNASIPIINAGDGGHQHPTQTLTDFLAIHSIKGRFDNLTIGLCGDLTFGRTVHSLVRSIARYPNNRFIFVAPNELRIPGYIRQILIKNGVPFSETSTLEAVIGEMDILYMTRVQKERFFNEEEYLRLKDIYILDKRKLSGANSDLVIMHPLPRVNEIAREVDDDPRARYFYQAQCGKFMRMALMMKLLEVM